MSKRRWQFLTTNSDESQSVELRYALNTVPGVTPQRAVIFANGRNEWIEKYERLAELLNLRDDTLLLTWDHRGQGASGGERCNITSYDHYARDMRTVIAAAKIGSLPYISMAHSMGSLVTLYTYMHGFIKPQAIVLCSPLLAMPNHPISRTYARPLASVMTFAGFGGVSTLADKHKHRPFKINKLTHDKETYKKMMRSPYRYPGAKFQWVKKTFEALDYVYDADNIKKLKVPVFIQGSGKEQVVDNIGITNWAERVEQYANIELTATVIPGALHELFAESDDYRKPALTNIQKWVGRYL